MRIKMKTEAHSHTHSWPSLLTKQTFLIDEMIAMEQFKLLKLNNIIYYKSQK